MTPGLALLFWALAAFELKHFLCDFVLQTAYQYRNKGRYGHPGGLVHAGLHVIGSFPVTLILTTSPELIALVLAAEFVVHYHMDWFKEKINKWRALKPDSALYWMVFGADQLVHQLTYVAMLAMLARTSF